MNARVLAGACTAMLLWACSVMPASAQGVGAIGGTIADASGAVLPGVTLTLSSPAGTIGANQTATTDERGTFQFVRLVPGTYRVRAEIQGFRPVTQERIAVTADATARVDLKLEIGGLEEGITVSGEAPLLDTTSAMRQTVLMVGNLLFIIYAAYVFAFAISYGGIGEQLTRSLVDLKLGKTEFMFALLVFYTILGCLVESVGMIVLTVPLLYPVLVAFGIDPVWFGVVLVLFIEMGQISPPIGINLFVIQSIWTGKLGEVVIGTIPFHIIMFVMVGLLILIPDIALWLPNRMIVAR